ncbi:MAG: RNA polymerase sigma factor [Candidatus Glassbacteria bacterium]
MSPEIKTISATGQEDSWVSVLPGPQASRSDRDLISLCIEGEESAFRELVDRYRAKIYSFVLRIIREPEDARDITQDVFVRLFRHLETFDTSRKFSTWLYRIAQNLSIDYLKKNGNANAVSIDAPFEVAGGEVTFQLPSKGLTPDRELEGMEIGEALEIAISELKPQHRSAIILRHIEGKSYSEISDILDIPLGTAKSLLFKARRLVRQKLEYMYTAICA